MNESQHANMKRWRSKESNRLSENDRNQWWRKKNAVKYKKSVLFSTIRCYMRKGFVTLREIADETSDLSLRR